jgi:thioredoxin 1
MHLSSSAYADEIIASDPGIVIVDISAEWCGPCRMLEPILHQLAEEIADLTVLELDIDASPELARRYDVMSFPTLLFFVEGQLVRRLIGARSLAALREEIDQVRTAVTSSA